MDFYYYSDRGWNSWAILFSSYPLFPKLVFALTNILVVLLLVAQTFIAHKAQQYWRDSLLEVRKVVWPTQKETTQTTVVVLVMVCAIGLILCSIDAVLIRLVEWLIRT